MHLPRFVYVALGTLLLLLIPFVAHWPWTLSDFVIAGLLIFGTALATDTILKRGGKYRLLAAAAIIFLFLWLWVELAVGLFTNWGS